MEDEFLAPTEISFTTPFKQAYRMGNGNTDDSYENSERYNCDDGDDDDLNFISSNMQHLALSEKKGRNRRQNVSAASPNSGPGLNLTFDMGVAESKENSFQEEIPSFLNFGGTQPAAIPITPKQKVHARSAHASPSCPTTTTPGSLSPRNSDLTPATTPPSEGPTKKQIITPLGVCTETEKSEKLCARFPPHDLNTSGQNPNSLPLEINASAQKLGAQNFSIETQKQSTPLREQFAAEQKLYEDFCIQQHPQSTPPRGLNISAYKHDAPEDFDIDYIQQCSPHEISTNEQATPPREHNVSCFLQTAPDNLNENGSFDSQKQRTPSRAINETRIQSSPEGNEVLLQNQGTPEKFCFETSNQLTPTRELPVSTVKQSTPESKYFDAETDKQQPGDVLVEKNGSPQQLFQEAKVESTPPRDVNVSSQTQYYTPQDVPSETEPQIISMENNIPRRAQGSPSFPLEKQYQRTLERENYTSAYQHGVPDDFNFETRKQKSPSPPCELNLAMQGLTHTHFNYGREMQSSLPGTHVSNQKQGSPQLLFEKQYQQTPPTPELNVSAYKQKIPDDCYFETQEQRSSTLETDVLQSQRNQDARFSQKQSSPPARDVSMQKLRSPAQLFSESLDQRFLPRDTTVFMPKQPTSDPNDFICESETQSSQLQNQYSPPRKPNVSAHNYGESEDSANDIQKPVTSFREHVSMKNPNTPLLVDFNASALKQNAPSWDTNDSKPKQSAGLHEPNVVIHKQGASENYIFELQKQATPPRGYSIPLQNPCTPLLVDFNVSSTHKQRTPPREINAVPQKQGTTQDYSGIINTMETLQLKTPPSGSSNFSVQNSGTPLLVDFGNGVSSQRQRQNFQPQALRYNNQEEYSPPPDRNAQTRKENTPAPQASEASCTTPTSEPILIGMKTPHPALKRLQDELLSQETMFEEQAEAKDEILKQKELELAAIYKKIDGLKSHKDKEGKTMIKKYEAKIANYSTELENLRASFAKSESKNVEVIKDRDQTYSDLRNVENAYNDLMGKYLRAKEMVGTYADAERHYKSRDEDMLHCLDKRDQKIELLKNQIQEMVEMTYQEYDTKLREKRHDNENLRVRLMRMEMRVDTLENDIEQKTRENAQLHTLCDEIISGRVAE